MIYILLCTFVGEYNSEKKNTLNSKTAGEVQEELALCMLAQNLKGFWDVNWI